MGKSDEGKKKTRKRFQVDQLIRTEEEEKVEAKGEGERDAIGILCWRKGEEKAVVCHGKLKDPPALVDFPVERHIRQRDLWASVKKSQKILTLC